MTKVEDVGSSATIDIVAWVKESLAKIKAHARKYLSYSPYELEEFVQTAYESALKAEKDSEYDFERSFWFHFRIACLSMTYSHGQKISCIHEEYREYGDDDNSPTILPFENYSYSQIEKEPLEDFPTDSTSMISDALYFMTEKERELWSLLLQGLSIKKAALCLGKSKTAVIKLRESGKRRVAEKFLN